MKDNKLYTFFTETLIERPDSEWEHWYSRLGAKIYKVGYWLIHGLFRHGTMVRSAAMTYYTLTSIVPILAVAFALVKGFGLSEVLVASLYDLFPQNPEIIEYLLSFAENALARTQGGVVAAVALVMLFWSIIQLFSSIESAFNNIWEVKTTRSIARQWSDYLAVILIVPIFWIVANSVGNFTEEILRDTWYFRLLNGLMSMVLIWVMFTLLYLIIPNAKVKLSSATVAGILAGTAFLLFQWGYIYLQTSMTSYNAIYGSFAALPLFLVWLQFSWQILLIGGELSFAHQNISRFGEEQEAKLISYDCRRKVMLATMMAIVRRFRKEGGAVPVEELQAELGLPTRVVNDILFSLSRAKQLIEVRKSEDERWVAYAPAYDINTMTIYGILEAVEKHSQSPLQFDPQSDAARVEKLLEGLKDQALQSPINQRIIDLIEENEA